MRSYGRPRFARERHSAPSNPFDFEASRDEVERIADLYRLTRRALAIVWTLGEVREDRLKSLAEAPRVLHLATHGFYLDPGEGSHNPLLDSGLALSGANQGLLGKTDPEREDGLLYSLEALGLNLQGTELVALSACETGRGGVDYSEGGMAWSGPCASRARPPC
jgi:CHAT domain-containing protein